MKVETYVWTERLWLRIFFVAVLWFSIPNLIAYTKLVHQSWQQGHATHVPPPSTLSVPSIPSGETAARTVQEIKQDAARKQASIGKVTAPKLESQLVEKKVVSRASRIHCAPVVSTWDYVCTYLPTPKTSSTRVQFGVQVDRDSWVRTSPIVPEGTMLPPPGK